MKSQVFTKIYQSLLSLIFYWSIIKIFLKTHDRKSYIVICAWILLGILKILFSSKNSYVLKAKKQDLEFCFAT